MNGISSADAESAPEITGRGPLAKLIVAVHSVPPVAPVPVLIVIVPAVWLPLIEQLAPALTRLPPSDL